MESLLVAGWTYHVSDVSARRSAPATDVTVRHVRDEFLLRVNAGRDSGVFDRRL